MRRLAFALVLATLAGCSALASSSSAHASRQLVRATCADARR